MLQLSSNTYVSSKFILVLLFFLVSPGKLQAEVAPQKKSQIEELFIWKVSDELKLTATEEKKFSEVFKALNQKKQSLQNQLQELLENSKLTSAQESKGQSKKIIARYRKITQELNELAIAEIEQIHKILGETKFASYLVLKQEINLKLKNLVLGNEKTNSSSSKKLPPPKITEEK